MLSIPGRRSARAGFPDAWPTRTRLRKSSVTAKIASESKAVKGLSRHKPTQPFTHKAIYSTIPLTALLSPAFGCLTVDCLKTYDLKKEKA
jgi:hypothetical protein